MEGVYIEMFDLLGVYIAKFTESPQYLHKGGLGSSQLIF